MAGIVAAGVSVDRDGWQLAVAVDRCPGLFRGVSRCTPVTVMANGPGPGQRGSRCGIAKRNGTSYRSGEAKGNRAGDQPATFFLYQVVHRHHPRHTKNERPLRGLAVFVMRAEARAPKPKAITVGPPQAEDRGSWIHSLVRFQPSVQHPLSGARLTCCSSCFEPFPSPDSGRFLA